MHTIPVRVYIIFFKEIHKNALTASYNSIDKVNKQAFDENSLDLSKTLVRKLKIYNINTRIFDLLRQFLYKNPKPPKSAANESSAECLLLFTNTHGGLN